MHYEEYWGLKLPPFENVPNPKFYFPSPKHEEGLHRLLYGVQARKGAVLLCGEIGCGKTMLTRTLLENLSPDRYDVALISNPSYDSSLEFFRELLEQLGLDPGGSKFDLLRRLNEHLLNNFKQEKDTVVIVDEAQAVRNDLVYEELRLLLNFHLNDRFLLTLLLLGQPELIVRINAITQLSQRIAVRFHLPAFTVEETGRYIDFRIKVAGGPARPIFSKEAVRLLFENSGGIPRNINTLADLSLLTGFLERKELIEGEIVSRVVMDFRAGGLSNAVY